jgi:hypothetical protein
MSMAEGMYFGGGLNNMDVGLDDNAIGLEAKIGKVFYNNFGIEGQISKSFSSAEEKFESLTLEIDVMAISVFATYSHNLTPQFTIMPKIGFTQYSMDASIGSVSEDDSSLGLSFGIDTKYHVNNNMNIYASFSKHYPKLDKYIATITFNDGSRSNLNFDKDSAPLHLSIGLEQKF